MIDPPRIVTLTPQETAVIRIVVPRAEIRNVMGPAFEELFGTVMGQGITPGGPAYSYHRRFDPEVFDFELGVPVTSTVVPQGRVDVGALPGGRAATTTYQGPYDDLAMGWGALMEWVANQGLTPAENAWEVYAHGPESTPNPREWQTHLVRPLL